MKIGIIDSVGQKSGMDYYDQELLLGFNKLQYETILISNIAHPLQGIINYVYFKKLTSNPFSKLINHLKYFKAFIKCKKLKCNNIILHIFAVNLPTLFVFMIAKFFNFNLVGIVHDVRCFAGEDILGVQNLFYTFFPNKIVVHNQRSFEEIKNIISLKALKKVSIIPQGGYPHFIGKHITKLEALELIGLPKNKKYLLFFGQIKKVKRLDLLLMALNKVNKDVHLIIAGRPWRDDFDNYKKIIEELDLQERVHCFIRFIEDFEKDRFFFASDVVVLPYDDIYQSAVILLALTYGKSVIVSDIDGFKQTISDDNGVFFKKGSIDSLVEAISKSLSNLNNKPPSLDAKFMWEDIAKKYDLIINNK